MAQRVFECIDPSVGEAQHGAYMDGSLAGHEERRFLMHVQACRRCEAWLRKFEAFVPLLDEETRRQKAIASQRANASVKH